MWLSSFYLFGGAWLSAESGYTATARSAAGIPEAMTQSMLITDDEKRVIDNWIRNSINEATFLIGRHLGRCSVNYLPDDGQNTAKYILSFPQPHNYPTDAIMQLGECIVELTTGNVQQQWCMTVKPDETSIPAFRVQQAQIRLKELLAIRSRPLPAEVTGEKIIGL